MKFRYPRWPLTLVGAVGILISAEIVYFFSPRWGVGVALAMTSLILIVRGMSTVLRIDGQGLSLRDSFAQTSVAFSWPEVTGLSFDGKQWKIEAGEIEHRIDPSYLADVVDQVPRHLIVGGVRPRAVGQLEEPVLSIQGWDTVRLQNTIFQLGLGLTGLGMMPILARRPDALFSPSDALIALVVGVAWATFAWFLPNLWRSRLVLQIKPERIDFYRGGKFVRIPWDQVKLVEQRLPRPWGSAQGFTVYGQGEQIVYEAYLPHYEQCLAAIALYARPETPFVGFPDA